MHEYTHIAMRNLCKTNTILPLWLREGLPSYLAKQKKHFNMSNKEESLSYYHENQNLDIYAFGYNMVKEIIDKYGKNKILELLKNTKKINTYKKFKKYYSEL
jgi:hypothetical protein